MSDRIGLAECSLSIPPCLNCILAGPIDPNIDWRETMSAFQFQLSLVHRKLDTEIRREQDRIAPDSWRLKRLKKLRLAIKDRMEQFRSVQWQHVA